MSLKCAMCSGTSGKKVKGFCVETNQVLCEKCIGLQTYPGMKGNDWTFEKIDEGHKGVQTITVVIVNVTVVFFMLFALLRSGISDDYFKGASTCPALSTGRQALARFDANAFYWYKSSLAVYCDIEDSFWRLLMDGWVRGVVSGSDSFLLLFSTLPKTYLFKTAVGVFLRPIYAVLYACCGMALGQFIIKFEDVVFKLMEVKNQYFPAGGGHSQAGDFAKRVFRIPGQIKAFFFTKWTLFQQIKLIFWGLSLSMTTRLLVHVVGLQFLAGTNHTGVSVWQLAFEPVCFWYLGVLIGKVQAKLDKTVWKKAAAAPTYPMTLWREKPMKNIVELGNYAKQRVLRSWRFYKQKAENIIHILFDDVFNMVVVLRLLSILFALAPTARTVAGFVGLGGMMERHQAWVATATGFTEVDSGRYISDRLASFGFKEATVVSKFLMTESSHQVQENFSWSFLTLFIFCLWRVIVPYLFYRLEQAWVKLIAKQNGTFKKQWQGTNWTDGAYAAQNRAFGSFWNEVATQEEWVAPTFALAKKPAPSAASVNSSKIKNALAVRIPGAVKQD